MDSTRSRIQRDHAIAYACSCSYNRRDLAEAPPAIAGRRHRGDLAALVWDVVKYMLPGWEFAYSFHTVLRYTRGAFLSLRPIRGGNGLL